MPARIVLAEVLAALSYALDLASGEGEGHTARSCIIGMRIGRELGLDTEARSDLYYTLLLKDAGCSGSASQLFRLFGTDDRVIRPAIRMVDWQNDVAFWRRVGTLAALGEPFAERGCRLARLWRNDTQTRDLAVLRGEYGAELVRQLGFSEPTASAVHHLDEHWNGRGRPAGLAGDEIPLTARIASLAHMVERFHRADGLEEALAMIRKRRGRWFEPGLVDLVLRWRNDEAWWNRLGRHNAQNILAEAIAEEPASYSRWVNEDGLDMVARTFADIVDVKSPYTVAHSRNVASYALAIGRMMGVDGRTQRRLYRAGLLHDVGKLSISNAILEKEGPLNDVERVAMERHPLHTWDILSKVPYFGDFAWSAAMHHERLDGTGYPWRVGGSRVDLTARILAVADVYEALTAGRPYRRGMSWSQASAILWKGRGSSFDVQVLEALDSCVTGNVAMMGLEPQAAA